MWLLIYLVLRVTTVDKPNQGQRQEKCWIMFDLPYVNPVCVPPHREAGQESPAEGANLKCQWGQLNPSITMSLGAELVHEKPRSVWHWLRAADVLMSYRAAYSPRVLCVCWMTVERGYFKRSGWVLKILLQCMGVTAYYRNNKTPTSNVPVIWRISVNDFRHVQW